MADTPRFQNVNVNVPAEKRPYNHRVVPTPPWPEHSSESDNSQEGELIQRPDQTFYDHVKNDLLVATRVNMNKAWNAWDQAQRFEQPDLEDYYMKLIIAIQAFQTKIKGIKKKD